MVNPLFSILIPTRNRAYLLGDALHSVLSQSLGDFEIIVSDNYSEDNTELVTKSFKDSRIKYYNTGKFLLNSWDPENKKYMKSNWDHAYSKATGQFIWLIGDDDYFLPNALENVKRIIDKKNAKIVISGIITFYDKKYFDGDLKDCVQAKCFTGKIFEEKANKILKLYFNLDSENGLPPHPSGFCINKSILDRINEKYNVVYPPVFGEIACTCRAMLLIDKIYNLDKPIVCVRRTNVSAVTKLLHNDDAMWKDQEKDCKYTIFKAPISLNFHVDTLLRVKNYEPDQFTAYEIPLEKYVMEYYYQLNQILGEKDVFQKYRKDFIRRINELHVKLSMHCKYSILVCDFKRIFRKTFLYFFSNIVRNIISKSSKIHMSDLGINNVRDFDDKLTVLAVALNQQSKIWNTTEPAIYDK